MSFESLKKNRGGNDLADKLKKMSETKSFKDENVWMCECDASGKGQATIRFLPPKYEDCDPYVTLYRHAFKYAGKWIIDNCPTTLGRDHACYCCEMHTKMWATEEKDMQNLVRERKRRTEYYTNILVVDDPKNPENNGKVFVFKMNKPILQKINDAIAPEFDTIQRMNPYDLWEGANFQVRIYKDDSGYQKFDKCSFDAPSVACGGDEATMKEAYEATFDLRKYIEPSKFKSYEELEKKFAVAYADVLPGHAGLVQQAAPAKREEPSRMASKPTAVAPTPDAVDDEDDGEMDMTFFTNLAAQVKS